MPNGRLSKLSWLLPLLLVLTATIFQELFSLIDNHVFDYLGAKLGYKALLLICLLLMSVLASLLIRNVAYSKITIGESHSDKEIRAEREQLLKNLSIDEKSLLQEYIRRETKVLQMDMGHSVANGLVLQHILDTTAPCGINTLLNFHLNPWVWEMLKQNPRLLE